eukprot:12023109-Ditylum_brightwellii.AAC.1
MVESEEKVVESAMFVNGYRPINKTEEDNQDDDDIVESKVSRLSWEMEEYVINMKAKMNKSFQNQDKKFDQLVDMLNKLIQQQMHFQPMQAQAAPQQAVPQ